MPIPNERLAYWISCFADRLGRQFAAPTFVEMARALESLGLSAEEFELAAQRVYASSPFLPAPLEFYFAARPSERPEEFARAALESVRKAVRYWRHEQGQGYAVNWSLVPAAQRGKALAAFESCGGSAEMLAAGEDFGFARRFQSAVFAAQRETLELACLPAREREPAQVTAGGA